MSDNRPLPAGLTHDNWWPAVLVIRLEEICIEFRTMRRSLDPAGNLQVNRRCCRLMYSDETSTGSEGGTLSWQQSR